MKKLLTFYINESSSCICISVFDDASSVLTLFGNKVNNDNATFIFPFSDLTEKDKIIELIEKDLSIKYDSNTMMKCNRDCNTCNIFNNPKSIKVDIKNIDVDIIEPYNNSSILLQTTSRVLEKHDDQTVDPNTKEAEMGNTAVLPDKYEEMISSYKLIAEGGEAFIYEYPRDKTQVLKIYKPEIDNKTRKDKYQKLLKLQEKIETAGLKNIIYPTKLLVSKHNKFVGYAMKRIDGCHDIKQLGNKKFYNKVNMTWENIIKLVCHIKDTLKELHSIDVIISDFNDQNILFDPNTMKAYFIDVDSFSVDGDMGEVVMELFKDPKMSGQSFSKETDYWAYSIIIFRLLTRVHPYGGIYKKDENMEILDRIKKNICVVDNKDVTLPNIALPFDRLPQNLQKAFRRIFINQERFLIDDELEEIMTKKSITRLSIPLSKPKVITDSLGDIPVTVLQEIEGTIIDWSKDDKITYFKDNIITLDNKISLEMEDNYRYYLIHDEILIIDSDSQFWAVNIKDVDKIIFQKPKLLNKNIIVKNNNIFYISEQMILEKMEVDLNGDTTVTKLTTLSKKVVFDVTDDEKFIAISSTATKKLINMNGSTFELNEPFIITEWGIHHDMANGNWLVILKDENMKYRMYIIDKHMKVIFREQRLTFDGSLANLDIYNDNIYIGREKKIVIYNWKKNLVKEINADFVDNDSKIYKDTKGLIIVGESTVVQLG